MQLSNNSNVKRKLFSYVNHWIVLIEFFQILIDFRLIVGWKSMKSMKILRMNYFFIFKIDERSWDFRFFFSSSQCNDKSLLWCFIYFFVTSNSFVKCHVQLQWRQTFPCFQSFFYARSSMVPHQILFLFPGRKFFSTNRQNDSSVWVISSSASFVLCPSFFSRRLCRPLQVVRRKRKKNLTDEI